MNNMKKLYMNLVSQGFTMENYLNSNKCYKRLIKHRLDDNDNPYDSLHIRILKDLVLYKSEKDQFWHFPYIHNLDNIIRYITFDGKTNGESVYPFDFSDIDEYERICEVLKGYEFKPNIPLYVDDVIDIPLEDLDADESRYCPMDSKSLYEKITFDYEDLYNVYSDSECNIVIILTPDNKCLVNYYVDPECGFNIDMMKNVYKR